MEQYVGLLKLIKLILVLWGFANNYLLNKTKKKKKDQNQAIFISIHKVLIWNNYLSLLW